MVCLLRFPWLAWEQLTQVTSEFSTPKSFATSVTVNETVAKSNASHILQKRNISTSIIHEKIRSRAKGGFRR